MAMAWFVLGYQPCISSPEGGAERQRCAVGDRLAQCGYPASREDERGQQGLLLADGVRFDGGTLRRAHDAGHAMRGRRKRRTPQHEEEIRRNRERRIDDAIFAFGMLTCAVTVLIVFSAWAR